MPSGELGICFDESGKSETIYAHQFEGGPFQIDCPALTRAPGDACPPGERACGYDFCGKRTIPYGVGESRAGVCCYKAVFCVYPNSCGRPLLVGGAAVISPLLVTGAWAA